MRENWLRKRLGIIGAIKEFNSRCLSKLVSAKLYDCIEFKPLLSSYKGRVTTSIDTISYYILVSLLVSNEA